MFNFFKKIKNQNTQDVITAIHNEFDVAGEKLLTEAKEILASDIDTSKGERLSKLGFGSSKAAVDAKTVEDIRIRSRQIAERVEYFRTYYPSYKFITEEMVETICKKYGLLCGDASKYIGDVPAKNVAEIEKFKLREEDKDDCFDFESYGDNYSFGSMSRNISSLQGLGIRSIGVDIDRMYERAMMQSQSLSRYKAIPNGKKTQREFKICAPVKDFDTRHMRIKDGYSLQEIPDPVVLQPVKGGYLVVSKWGLEANDESLINETNN